MVLNKGFKPEQQENDSSDVGWYPPFILVISLAMIGQIILMWLIF